jgi:hypothetical protein
VHTSERYQKIDREENLIFTLRKVLLFDEGKLFFDCAKKIHFNIDLIALQ